MQAAANSLAPNRFAIFVVGNYRDQNLGKSIDFGALTTGALTCPLTI
jgi:hypothetical protein